MKKEQTDGNSIVVLFGEANVSARTYSVKNVKDDNGLAAILCNHPEKALEERLSERTRVWRWIYVQ